MEPGYQYCLDSLRETAPARATALLFLPEEIRGPAAALNAFNEEIENIAFVVSEPMPGEIRLQWWRDVLHGDRQGEAAANPLATALLNVIKTNKLPKDGFARYLDARLFDLYNDPMPDRHTIEAYFGETESFILQMVANSAGLENSPELANACGHGGIVIGIAKMLRRLAYDRGRQRVFIPADMLAESGLTSKEWLSVRDQRHEAVLESLIAYCTAHYDEFSNAVKKLPKNQRAVFLPVATARAVAIKAARNRDSWQSPVNLLPIGTHWTLWKAVLTGY